MGVFLVILLVLPLPAVAADLQTMRTMAEHLRALKVGPSPSRGATPLLTAFKHELRDWVESQLPSADNLPQDFETFSAALSEKLTKAGLLPPRSAGELAFGYVMRLDVSRPKGYDDLVQVLTGVSIPCGSDDSAYLYEWGQNRWARRFEAERNDYQHDYAPQELKGVYFSPRDENGDYLLLTVGLNPECFSAWNVLYHRLYRLAPSGAYTILLLDGEHSVYLGQDSAYDVALREDNLTLEFVASSIDTGVHSRTHVLRYRVEGSQVRRVAPVALQPQDFVDEWLTRPWSEMEVYSAPSELTELRDWHRQLHSDFVHGEFQLVQRCQEDGRFWQIGLAMNYDERAQRFLDRMYFFVWQHEDYHFEMLNVSPTRQPGCSGQGLPTSKYPSLFHPTGR
jgi:hypothetical protein